MILFLILLLSGVIKKESFDGGISDFILKNLSFFFLPPAVRILESLDVLQGGIAKLIIVMMISNTLVLAVTGMAVQYFIKTGETHD
jgi:holin-like protein